MDAALAVARKAHAAAHVTTVASRRLHLRRTRRHPIPIDSVPLRQLRRVRGESVAVATRDPEAPGAVGSAGSCGGGHASTEWRNAVIAVTVETVVQGSGAWTAVPPLRVSSAVAACVGRRTRRVTRVDSTMTGDGRDHIERVRTGSSIDKSYLFTRSYPFGWFTNF